jgi:hypothetical protein
MPRFPERLESEFLFDAEVDLAEPEVLGATPFGTRSIHIVRGGTFEGPKMRGVYLPGGGDWLLSLPGGAGELDVRGTMRTDDGALVHISYHGVLDAPPAIIQRVFAGERVSPSEYYFRTTPRFETGAERYAWLNTLVAVGVGAFARNKVWYRVFAIR